MKAVVGLYIAVMADIFKENEGDRAKEIATIEKQLKGIDEWLLQIDRKYVEEKLTEEAYKRLMNDSKKKQDELERRKTELQSTDTNFMKYVQYGFSLVADLARYYLIAPVEVKQKMVGLIFPKKIMYENGEYRTTTQNAVLTLFSANTAKIEQLFGKGSPEIRNPSRQVEMAGVEPASEEKTSTLLRA